MPYLTLTDAAALLAAMAIAAPIARWLGVGTVLGYLTAGVILGPHGVRLVFSDFEAKEILHFAEFGVVLLLFLIGLELRPKRLMAMRDAIFGLGGAQVGLTALALAIVGVLFQFPPGAAIFAGLALALSSTAFALQVLEENGELSARHGRLSFAVLLFQDLAAIPLIAIAPLLAVSAGGAGPSLDFVGAAKGLATIAAVAVAGHFLLDRALRLVALTRVREAMTAAALLTVVGVTLVMQQAGLSASLGAFIAGALLAESSYRHQVEADIQPFEGLLLGLFFTAVGMSLNLDLLRERPGLVVLLVGGLVAIKAAVLHGLGRWHGLSAPASRRLGLTLSQGGEFAFVLLAAGAAHGVIGKADGDLLAVVVTLSMAATPLLLLIDKRIASLWRPAPPRYDALPDNDGHVIIAGFGRFGQIIARVLKGKKIPFTALDISAEQVELVKRFGSHAFFGDASRPDILDAAKAESARAFVLAINDVEASMRTVAILKARYPSLPIYACARDRNHAYRLLDAGVTNLRREAFDSALELTRQLLKGLGMGDREAERTIATFRAHDERRLIEEFKHYSDTEKLQLKARSDAATLERLFAEDAAEQASLETAEKKERA